jgi:hypothetical protein
MDNRMALYAILYTNNDITRRELEHEVITNKILPILTLDPMDGGPIVAPCFESVHVARKFAQRNLPKNHPIATILLNEESVEQIEAKGLVIYVYDWPRRLTDISKLGLEIIENTITPEITDVRN